MNRIKQTLCALRPYLLAALAAAFCLACFVLVWFQFLRSSPEKSRSIYLNDEWDAWTAPLSDGLCQSQTFTTEGPLYGVGVMFRRLAPGVDGTLSVRLVDMESGETSMDLTGTISQVTYDGYTAFSLAEPVTDGSRHVWRLEITAHYTAEPGQLALAKSSQTAAGFGPLQENGADADGTLALLACVEQLGIGPVCGFWVLGIVCALPAAALTLLCLAKRRPGKAWLTFFAVLAIGLCYQFVLPAYSAPDEATHYHTAYALSNRWMGLSPTDPENNFIQRQCDELPEFSDYYTTAYTYRYMLEHLTDRAPAQDACVESRVELLGGYRLPYLLSAAGITLARLLHLGGVATAMLARLGNLILFAAMAALAVWLAPTAKGLFAAFALLPMTLHLAGSFSYDSLLLALVLPFTALLLRCALQDTPVTTRQSIGLGVLCALIAPLKAVYVPLCLLVFLIPAGQYASRRSRIATRAGVVGAAGLHFAWYNLTAVLNLFPALQTSAADTAAQAATYSLPYLLLHPGILLQLLCNTFFGHADADALSVLGGRLGYLNLSEIPVSGLLIVGFLLLLLLGCVPPEAETRRFSLQQRLLVVFVALCVLGALGVVCIYWTPADDRWIWGFQGRYLLPVLPCVLLALPLDRLHAQNDTFFGILYAGVWLELLTLLNVLAVVFQR